MIHEVIVQARKDKGLSQDDLAKEAGVSQATISRIETGDAEPSLQVASKIARELGLEIQEIFPEQRLEEIFGHFMAEEFFAFCPNPLCKDNSSYRENDQSWVRWSSGKSYPMERYQEVNFCPSCGEDLLKECPNCKRLLERIGARFCIACGEKISERPTREEWLQIEEILGNQEPKVEVEDEIPF